MSSFDVTVSLINAKDLEEVKEVLIKAVKLHSGYIAESISFSNNKLEIIGRSETNGSTMLLCTDLVTGHDIYGRKHFNGLSGVDITIIRNHVDYE